MTSRPLNENNLNSDNENFDIVPGHVVKFRLEPTGKTENLITFDDEKKNTSIIRESE